MSTGSAVRPVRAVEVCLDVNDPVAASTFWCELLGYAVDGDPTGSWVHLVAPAGLPTLNLQTVPEGKAGKNRLHLDVFVDDPEAWIDRALSLGASVVRRHEHDDDWFWVLADPEGNELCICRERE